MPFKHEIQLLEQLRQEPVELLKYCPEEQEYAIDISELITKGINIILLNRTKYNH